MLVYLGLKDGIQPTEMISDLGQHKKEKLYLMPIKILITFPAKKHDHFLISAGTCSTALKECDGISAQGTIYFYV